MYTWFNVLFCYVHILKIKILIFILNIDDVWFWGVKCYVA